MMLVLVVALLLLLLSALSPAAGGQSLPGCPTSCGNISVPYPFGIAPGCFRPGFQLTCNQTTTKLFLELDSQRTIEVTEISLKRYGEYVTIKVSVFTMSSESESDSYNASWMDLKGTPYTLSYSNKFVVTGCGVVGYLIDLDTREVISTCASFCYNMNITEADECHGLGCCSAYVYGNLKSYSIQLHRLNRSTEANVFLFGRDGMSLKEDIISGLIHRSAEIPVMLNWVIGDELSCEHARRNKSSYACRGDKSHCNDKNIIRGYTCVCSYYNHGNPYITHGCQEDLVAGPAVTKPRPHCPTTCGNVSVPFPFGFESGCYRDANFNLTCNTTFSPPTLQLLQESDMAQVTEIMVEEGKLRAKLFNTSPDSISGQVGKLILSTQSQLVNWVADNLSCEKAKRNKSSFACISDHSECKDAEYDFFNNHESGYLCKCTEGYTGNPYIQDGCQGVPGNPTAG